MRTRKAARDAERLGLQDNTDAANTTADGLPPTKKRKRNITKRKGPKTTQVKQIEIIEPVKENTLLGIPPELRNEIYRYVLVEGDISIPSDGLVQPGLLRSNRQLRKEASGIFLSENSFLLRFTDLRPLLPSQHWLNSRCLLHRTSIELSGMMSWENLKQWLKMCHGTRYYPAVGEGGDEFDVVSFCFTIVHRMKPKPWHQVEKTLEEYRRATKQAGFQWQ